MTNRIFVRLVLYFTASIVAFAVIIGCVFFALFSGHNTALHKAELERRAISIADTLSEMFTDTGRMGGGGLGAYLRFIEDIAMTDVWIVDRDLRRITFGRGHRHGRVSYAELPDGAEQIVLDAFDGRTSVSEVFSTFLEAQTITVATPIITTGGTAGVVLLHSRVENVTAATNSGLLLLFFSMTAAIIVSVFIAFVLSSRFTKPLGRMKETALLISGGDYSARTDVRQSDEIGELADILDNLAARLGLAAQESAKLDNLRRDFIANISHELRTPITVIRGSLEAINDGVVTDTAKIGSYIRQMLSESIYLERLVSDLLDLSRLQNPDFAMEIQKLDLQSIADDFLRGMSPIAEQKGVNLEFVQEGAGFEIVGDYGRLRQMFIIVLDNAIKFSPPGKTVTVTLAKTETAISLSVRDRGSGIAAADLPHIFGRFYKQRTEQNKSGTGLGLAIAKQIADRHGIEISAESFPETGFAETSFSEEGAKFTFVIKI